MQKASDALAAGNLISVVSPCGIFVMSSTDDVHFVTLLVGRQLAYLPPEKPDYFVVDDLLVDARVVSESAMGLKPGRFRGPKLLREYRDWELKWLAKDNGWPRIRPEEIETSGSPKMVDAYSLWSFRPPRPFKVFTNSVSRISYATVAIEGVVFTMAAPIRPSDDIARIHDRLHKWALGVERVGSRDQLLKEIVMIQEAVKVTNDCRALLEDLKQRLAALGGGAPSP